MKFQRLDEFIEDSSDDLEPFDTTTPRGKPVRFLCRVGVNDRTTVSHVCTEDEYKQPIMGIGLALDVGAHIGSWSIPLLIDNPGVRVVAVEPIPENVALLRRNATLNGVDDRLKVYESAFGPGLNIRIYYGSEEATYVGRSEAPAAYGRYVEVPTISVWQLVLLGYGIDVMKIDCEGGEGWALNDKQISSVPFIAGEWHGSPSNVITALIASHEIILRGFNFWATML